MAQTIGQVIFISGNAKAVDSSGNERVLDINSMVFLGETIVTEGTDSRILLKMDNNQSITMGRNDKLTLDSDIYDPNQLPAEESIASVESIQEALLNDPNFDPSQLEATAAGGNEAGPGDSSTDPIIITHNAQDVEFDFLDTPNPVNPEPIADGNIETTGGEELTTVIVDNPVNIIPALNPVNPINTNNEPSANEDTITIPEDSSATIIDVLANDTDLDGDTLTVDSVTQPANGTVTLVNGEITYTPNPDYNGSDSFTYIISDGNGGTDTATILINVTPEVILPTATISVNPDITADDVINAAEAGGNVTITGSVGGDAKEGDTVSLTVNGVESIGLVAADFSFSIDVTGSDLAADPDSTIDAKVDATDDSGNTITATDTETYTVDLVASATITIDPITADDVVNAAEAGGTIVVTGTVGGDAADGDTVSFTLNGNNYSGTVSGGSYSIDVAGSDLAADTSFDATVTGSDNAGNPFSSTTTSTHTVDLAAGAAISVDAITADDVVNAAEAGGTIVVTGTVGGDAAPGDTVSFTINGTDYSGSVLAGNTYSITVAGSDLAADTSFDA
ncbi:MAG: Ig-like domain-containing protein, partial [Gammaproteobacteria bacterium]|nr:Ig-like domain-containing protein [Gammaproteobacteria bacterium]